MTSDSDEIDRPEVATIFGCTVRHTYNLQKTGSLSKGRKINLRGDRRWKRSDVLADKKRYDAALED